MKRIKHSRDWGEIIEYTRYRGKGGHFISDKWGKTLQRRGSDYLKIERSEWLYQKGRRVERITVESPDRVVKTTSPFAVADAEGDIYKTLQSTNIFTQISSASKALINIRGRNRQGEVVRLQGEIVVGEKNQDQQLAMAVNAILDENGYGERNYYDLMRLSVRGRRSRRQNIKLTDTVFTITLLA